MKQTDRESRTRWIKLTAFFGVLAVLCVIGIFLPRPTESEIEKRKLTEFPAFTWESFWSGKWFSGIDTWYADTYPLRELLIGGNKVVQSLYGIRSDVIVGGENQGEEIPDIEGGQGELPTLPKDDPENKTDDPQQDNNTEPPRDGNVSADGEMISGLLTRIWGWISMLKVQELQVNYGGIRAVKNISFEVPDGSIVTLVGANGAGKSTTLRTIAGQVKAQAGSITYNGEELLGKPSDEIVKRGITLVPEGRRVFPDMTVLENMKIGAYLRHDKLDDDIEWCYELFPRLKERHWQLAGTLSGGEQQMLAVARALMSRPKLMMMDEPSLGLAPLIVRDIFQIIREINKQGVTILLIEQNANMALHTADRGYVMETGEIILEGAGRELLENPVIREAYLGK